MALVWSYGRVIIILKYNHNNNIATKLVKLI